MPVRTTLPKNLISSPFFNSSKPGKALYIDDVISHYVIPAVFYCPGDLIGACNEITCRDVPYVRCAYCLNLICFLHFVNRDRTLNGFAKKATKYKKSRTSHRPQPQAPHHSADRPHFMYFVGVPFKEGSPKCCSFPK